MPSPSVTQDMLSLPERTDVVEVGKGHRPHSFRRCSGSGAARCDSESKADWRTRYSSRRICGIWNIT